MEEAKIRAIHEWEMIYTSHGKKTQTFIIRPFSQLNHFREITLAVRFLHWLPVQRWLLSCVKCCFISVIESFRYTFKCVFRVRHAIYPILLEARDIGRNWCKSHHYSKQVIYSLHDFFSSSFTFSLNYWENSLKISFDY